MSNPTRIKFPSSQGAVSTNDISGGGIWWDEKFALIGRTLDTSSGRLVYDYAENTVNFADNARYADTEQVSITTQLNHDWLTGSGIRPHFHWIQSAADIPNIVLGYRCWDNGDAVPSWTLVKPAALPGMTGSQVFTYVSGNIAQVTTFAEMDLSSITGLSANLQFKIWRDTDLGSGEYAVADPLTGDWAILEFDYHYQRDSMGSQGEYQKF